MAQTAQAESTGLVPAAQMKEIMKLDEAAKASCHELQQAELAGNEMAKALIVARAMNQLRSLMSDAILKDVMLLQGSPLGFRTDKDTSGGYKQEAVREVMVQALIRGLRPTGNEINIIAANLYVTKEGFARLLRELPGFSDLQIEPGVPQNVGDGALVPVKAAWTYQGTRHLLECVKRDDGDFRIAVRVNKGMGSDAILGKAESKLLRRIYARCTGSMVGIDPDEDDSDGDDEETQTANER